METSDIVNEVFNLYSLKDPDIVGFGCKLGLVIIASLAGNGR